MAITKPPVLPAWAESGDKVTPSNAEIQVGWPLSSIPPSRQRFNWLLNFLANGIRYFSRRGLPDYDVAETYMSGDRIIGDDGKTYRSLIDNNTAQTPSTSPTKWERWALTLAEMYTSLTTPAQFDNSVKPATTEFVKTSGKTSRGITSSAVSTTLTAADIGGTFFIGGVSAGLTITLPSASIANIRNGDAVTIVNTNSNAATVAANGSETIYRGTGTVTSFTIQPGDCVVFERQSATQWLITSDASNFGPLGAGQTWQNLTGSRALNTSYTNTTGKPMAVSVYWSAGAPAQLNFVAGGVTGDVAGNGSTGFCTSRVIVPPGATYQLQVASGSATIGAWYELK